MTYIADLDPNNPAILADEARVEWFDENMPAWDVREGYGDRFVSESDMAVPGSDTTLAVLAISDADFDAMCEALWTDPAERDY